MQNQFFKIAWAEPPGLSLEKGKVMPPGNPSFFTKTRLTGNAACDWHGICNNAGCQLNWIESEMSKINTNMAGLRPFTIFAIKKME